VLTILINLGLTIRPTKSLNYKSPVNFEVVIRVSE